MYLTSIDRMTDDQFKEALKQLQRNSAFTELVAGVAQLSDRVWDKDTLADVDFEDMIRNAVAERLVEREE